MTGLELIAIKLILGKLGIAGGLKAIGMGTAKMIASEYITHRLTEEAIEATGKIANKFAEEIAKDAIDDAKDEIIDVIKDHRK